MEYERITKRFGDGSVNVPFGAIQIDKGFNRLAELEDKIENGTLIELPCKVGDTVWFAKYYTFKDGQTPITVLESWEVFGVLMYEDLIMFKVTHKGTMDYRTFDLHEFNNCWFLTKAEAEAKLKELRDER